MSLQESETVAEGGLDDTVRRMEEAIAKAKGEEVPTEENEKVVAQPKDDGW